MYEVVTWEECLGYRACVAIKLGTLHVHTVTFSRDDKEDTKEKIAAPRDELAKHFRIMLMQGEQNEKTIQEVIDEMKKQYTGEVIASDQRNIGRWFKKLSELIE